jgi:hypothetical protein
MSSINVTNIKSRQGSAPTFPQGLNVSAGVATFAGNVSIAGTLTYDDVTNVDSVGIITAGKGFRATTGGIIVSAGIVTVGAGVTISSDFIHLTDNSKINLGIASDLKIYHNGTNSFIDNNTGSLKLNSGAGAYVQATEFKVYDEAGSETVAEFVSDGAVNLYYDNSNKFSTVGTGVSIFGGMKVQSGLLRESVNISATALNSDKVINLSDGMVHYRSSAVGAANVKLNVISSAGINTDLAIGDAMTLTVITAAGSASHYVDQIRIDGVEASAGVTTHWVGGSAPTDGGASGVDTYAFNILKTGNAAYLVVANKVATS